MLTDVIVWLIRGIAGRHYTVPLLTIATAQHNSNSKQRTSEIESFKKQKVQIIQEVALQHGAQVYRSIGTKTELNVTRDEESYKAAVCVRS